MQKRKLSEVMWHLGDVKRNIQGHVGTYYTPPQNIEDCCCLSALQCFRTSLPNITSNSVSKLSRSLKSNLVLKGLERKELCKPSTNCTECTSHQKENASEFFNRLESLIQRAINRLNGEERKV
ncbi:hypothetical protein PAMA_017021 [Pampus argenteus]